MVCFPGSQATISFWAARYSMSKPSIGRGRRKGHCRVLLSSGADVEISFAPVSWASIAPLDAGTRRVITDGCRILHDPAGFLEPRAPLRGGAESARPVYGRRSRCRCAASACVRYAGARLSRPPRISHRQAIGGRNIGVDRSRYAKLFRLPCALDAYNIHLGCGQRVGFDGHKAHNGHVQRWEHETSETGVRSEQGQSRTRPEA